MQGVLHQMFGSRVLHAIRNWTQSDLRFCKNDGSERSRINEDGDQLDKKSKEKIDIKCLKTVKIIHFGEKLDQI